MPDQDAQLIADFFAGSEPAFEKLIKKYLKPVYNFLGQLTHDHSALDDLTQATFLKAWQNIRRFDSRKNFKVWLFAIAKNTAYDYLRRKKTLPFAVFENAEGENKLENISAEEILPDKWLEQKDAARELVEKVKELPQQYQLILNLRYREDFSLFEISEILQIPYNTIKSQHQRALQALKKVFTKK